jgi:hypothetical protein
MSEVKPLDIENEITRLNEIIATRKMLADFYRKYSHEKLLWAHVHGSEEARLRKHVNDLKLRLARGEPVIMGDS